MSIYSAQKPLFLALFLACALGQEFYCPQNDDGCGWEMAPSNDFCYKKYDTARTFSAAHASCFSESIANCPAGLLEVDNVHLIASSIMTSEDERYRIQAMYNDDSGDWEDLEGNTLTFPDDYTMSSSEPDNAENNMGDSAYVNYNTTYIGANLTVHEAIGYLCQGCILQVPVCASDCDTCMA